MKPVTVYTYYFAGKGSGSNRSLRPEMAGPDSRYGNHIVTGLDTLKVIYVLTCEPD